MALEQLTTDKPLAEAKTTPFRAVAARANYLAADRPDRQYAAKEVCRWMAKPTELAMQDLKRFARYLVGTPSFVWHYKWQKQGGLDVYTDTDWAGCIRTRKSTSGGCILLGHACKALEY